MSTVAAHQRSANPDPPAPVDVQLAYEIAGVESPSDHAEVQMATWLKLPGYREAFEVMYRDPDDRVLFDDVAIARRALAEASGTLGPDGLRESPELSEAEQRLQTALDTLKGTLMDRKVSATVAALLANRPTWTPARHMRVSA